ncbi:MAG: glutathione peroxidase [Saprospiraceae bacterium]|jgi:glutathione peroxidase|nr:glutathione peroxidase [Saprospiraceae bacterium]MBL0025058.1 glutathione peroxidase [Saprospiraceae bacterium]
MLFSATGFIKHYFNSDTVLSSADTNINQAVSDSTSFHSLSALSIDGKLLSMNKYSGKKVIVLNVASKCGYTPQYADWEAFFENNKANYVVLGFPCNQFLGQEPGTAEEIESFCQKNYGVTFQMFDKIDVKGDNQSPLYAWLTNPKLNGWNHTEPSWNFSKYLIDENGKLLNYFGPKIKPDSPEFLAAIK